MTVSRQTSLPSGSRSVGQSAASRHWLSTRNFTQYFPGRSSSVPSNLQSTGKLQLTCQTLPHHLMQELLITQHALQPAKHSIAYLVMNRTCKAWSCNQVLYRPTNWCSR